MTHHSPDWNFEFVTNINTKELSYINNQQACNHHYDIGPSTQSSQYIQHLQRDLAHLTRHGAGPPGEQFGLEDRQPTPVPTAPPNLRCIR